ncbi:polyprenyl synthetase family protein [Legionella oakridgensis]|uniref:polyprenyl synthetase family protein n=1 Tax=Legionella oakridgensis TaxID=29423 RepID=UPI0003DE53B7|nr:polyprenyl synthetase family protein [Legionella oakridgensis]ETO93704.1 farnesyl-diphosphate synthase [Legionella oakridgensis RV-2-2007]
MSNQRMGEYLIRHEAILKNILNRLDIPAPRIQEAILYALFPGGKRLRPMLVYLCGKLVNVPLDSLDIIAVAIELTHCYSLVHDDLPSMDNDDFRRGKPSCHRAFDEATAILVGDGMQALAIEILLNFLPKMLSLRQVIAVTQELVKASGPAGMVSGQSLDLSELAKPHIDEAQLCEIHQLKTGKLISACINMVLAAGTPSPEMAEALRRFATHLGLVFQMQDDYLDRYGNGKLGKGRASDAANQKITFATLYDKKELLSIIQNLYLQAHQELSLFSPDDHDLLCLLRSLQKPLEM